MRWNYKLGKVAGIQVNIHLTFLLLLVWVAITNLSGGPTAALVGTALVAMVFGIVVLHELGHALAARSVGIQTRDITLWPIGGVARLEHLPERPKDELLVAAAGPAVNVVLAGLATLGLVMLTGPASLWFTLTGGSFLAWLVWINVGLAVFNLIPAFPMDGGRILRALLAYRMDYVRATETATKVARWVALAMGLAGLATGRTMLVFIAIFVWFASTTELAMLRARSMGFFGGARRYSGEVEVLDDPLHHDRDTTPRSDSSGHVTRVVIRRVG